MKVYKIIDDEEKIELTPEVNLFENVNTHSGDNQETILSIEKDKENTIKNFMLELSITDNDTTYVLKKNTNEDDSVYYFRTLTGKSISFKLYTKKDDYYIILKPDKNGVFYIEKNWSLSEPITLKLELICEENFSDRFGENKTLLISINFLGDKNEEETFA